MVRRLVEDEEVRARRDHEREREPAPLATREGHDRLLVRLPAREEEAPEERLRLRPRQPGRSLRAVEHAAALVQLDLVLREVRGLDAVAEPHRAGDGLAATEDRLQKRGLPRAVRPDEADVLAALDRERRAREQVLLARRYGEVLRLEDGAAAAARLEEVEAERLAPPGEQLELTRRVRALLLQPRDVGQLRLGLLRLALLVPEPLDEALEPRDVGADALGRLRRRCSARRLLEAPDVPGAREEERAAGLELEDSRRDRLEEPAVVGDEDDGGVQ